MSVRILASTSRALASGSSGRVFASRAVQSTVQRRKDALFDPYPLPLSPGVVKQQPLSQDSEEWPIPPPLDRTGEDEATLRARLVYQSRKRGTLETDLILATFAREQLPKMSYDELMEFDKLLDEPDWDIFYWAVQKREPPAKWANTRLLQRLIQHAKNEGKVVRIMPALLARGGAPL